MFSRTTAAAMPRGRRCSTRDLSLGELRRAAGSLQAVLLSFLHSGVAGQEAGGLQLSTVLGVDLQQGAGNAVTDGAGLTGHAAALDGADNINAVDGAGGVQGKILKKSGLPKTTRLFYP